MLDRCSTRLSTPPSEVARFHTRMRPAQAMAAASPPLMRIDSMPPKPPCIWRAAIATAARVGLWKRATSLGGVESLIEHRASIEGPGTPCPPDLLRLSTGIEDPDDLYADLDEALTGAHAADKV